MILEICVSILTITFIILTIYIIKTLISIKHTVDQIGESLKKLDNKIEPVSEEAVVLLQNSNLITEQVRKQLSSFSHLTESVSHLGDFIDKGEHYFKSHARNIEENNLSWQEKTARIIDLAANCALAWQNYKRRR